MRWKYQDPWPGPRTFRFWMAVWTQYIETRTNQICQTWLWACAEWREVRESRTSGVGPGQRPRSPSLTKRIAASGNEIVRSNIDQTHAIALLTSSEPVRWILAVKAEESRSRSETKAIKLQPILCALLHGIFQVAKNYSPLVDFSMLFSFIAKRFWSATFCYNFTV